MLFLNHKNSEMIVRRYRLYRQLKKLSVFSKSEIMLLRNRQLKKPSRDIASKTNDRKRQD